MSKKFFELMPLALALFLAAKVEVADAGVRHFTPEGANASRENIIDARQHTGVIVARNTDTNILEIKGHSPLVLRRLLGAELTKDDWAKSNITFRQAQDSSILPVSIVSGNSVVPNPELIKENLRTLVGKKGKEAIEVLRQALLVDDNGKNEKSDFKETVKWMVQQRLLQQPISEDLANKLQVFFGKRYAEAFAARIPDVDKIPCVPLNQPQTVYMSAPSPTRYGHSREDVLNAHARWEGTKRLLTKLGADVRVIDYDHTADGSQTPQQTTRYAGVWTRDRGLIINNTVYVPEKDLKAKADKQAQPNEMMKKFSGVLSQDGITTMSVEGSAFEGGDVLFDEKTKTAFIGYGDFYPKENAEAFASFMEKQGIKVIMLEKDEDMILRYYHLDTAMSILPGGELIWVPEAFSKESQDAVINHFKNRRSFSYEPRQDSVSKGAHHAYVANLLAIGKNVLLSGELGDKEKNDQFQAFLKEGGYTPIVISKYWGGQDWSLADSGIHCQVNTAYQMKEKTTNLTTKVSGRRSPVRGLSDKAPRL